MQPHACATAKPDDPSFGQDADIVLWHTNRLNQLMQEVRAECAGIHASCAQRSPRRCASAEVLWVCEAGTGEKPLTQQWRCVSQGSRIASAYELYPLHTMFAGRQVRLKIKVCSGDIERFQPMPVRSVSLCDGLQNVEKAVPLNIASLGRVTRVSEGSARGWIPLLSGIRIPR